jgi:hypothetical protein
MHYYFRTWKVAVPPYRLHPVTCDGSTNSPSICYQLWRVLLGIIVEAGRDAIGPCVRRQNTEARFRVRFDALSFLMYVQGALRLRVHASGRLARDCQGF